MSAKSVKELSLMELAKVGAHRGNKKSTRNPRLKRYIHTNKDSLSIIDLAQTKALIEKTEEFLQKLGSKKRQILIVGTSNNLQKLTQEYADSFTDKPMPYVDYRWLGGTLTNWPTVRRTLKRLEKNEKILADEKFMASLSRNERLSLERETVKLKKVFDGLKNLKSNRPGAILVLDPINNKVAVQEAQVLGVPVIMLANTATKFLPENTDYTIIANNSSTNFVRMILDRFVAAYSYGLTSISSEEETEKK